MTQLQIIFAIAFVAVVVFVIKQLSFSVLAKKNTSNTLYLAQLQRFLYSGFFARVFTMDYPSIFYGLLLWG
jgi:branched-subunit amino acid transport protein AzlD